VEGFQILLEERMKKFGLELAKEKTRLILFGRFAKERKARFGKRPETFDFLGFKHVCGVDRKGKFSLMRILTVKSCRKFLDRVHQWLKGHVCISLITSLEKCRDNGFYGDEVSVTVRIGVTLQVGGNGSDRSLPYPTKQKAIYIIQTYFPLIYQAIQ
jgi:hypothetical protein